MPALDRILFFGTPGFAVPTLAALVEAGRRPALVVTQPARPVGRGNRVQDPPVAVWARAHGLHGLKIEQPEKVRDPAFLARAAGFDPDIAVVVAFGQIFPRDLLNLPRYGCVNVHASLLPRWRGAAPIQAALAAGDPVTGITTMLMEQGLDTGPMLLREETEVGPVETAGELSLRLAEMGGRLLVRTLARLERGDLEPVPQDDAEATYAPRLTRESGRIDWALPAHRLFDLLRAYTPWPGLFALLGGEPVKILRAAVLPETPVTVGMTGAVPGTFLGLRESALAVACGAGTVLGLAELQRPGRKALTGAVFANGERLRGGEVFA